MKRGEKRKKLRGRTEKIDWYIFNLKFNLKAREQADKATESADPICQTCQLPIKGQGLNALGKR
jgi:hypothetical protein